MFPTIVGALPGRKIWLCLVLVLGLLLSHGAFLSQAQTGGYVLLMGSGSLHESRPWSSARLKVSRVLFGASYDSQSFRICFTGSATPGTDYIVINRKRGGEVSLSGGCFTDSWGSGDWYAGAENLYLLRAKKDNVPDPKETITATVDQIPSSYSTISGYNGISFTIRGG